MSTTETRGGRIAPSKAEIDEARALAREVGLEYVDLDRYPLNAAASSLLPEQLARRDHALAVGWKYGTPVIAVAAPDNVLAMDDIRTVVGRDIHAVVACGSQIDAYIERMYNQGASAPKARAAATEAPTEAAKAPSSPADEAAPPASVPIEAAKAAAPPPPTPQAEPPPPPPPPPAPSAAKASTPAPAEAKPHAPAAPSQAAAPPTATSAAAPAPSPVPTAAPAPPAKSAATPQTPPSPQPPAPAGTKGRRSEPEAAKDRPPEFLPEDSDEDELEVTEPESARSSSDGGTQDQTLAKLLVESGQVTPEEMQAALREASATGRKLGEILSELGLVTEEDLIRAMAEEIGLEFVDLNDFSMDLKAIQSIPEAMAKRHQILSIGYRNGVPIIAMANPSNVFAMDDLRTVLGRDIVTVVSSPRQITDYISRMYRHDKEASDAATRAAIGQRQADTATERVELTDLHAVTDDAPIVKYVNLILRQALQERASDIHIEPTAEDLRVRFRIDGVLHDITRSPKAIQGGVTTRLKVMAELDIAEHRVPQDGRISLNAGSREVDLRVATLPTVHGEKVVMRILDKSNAMLDLGDLGFLPEVQERYKESYRKPYGTILVTGPTGSGKSTTLYATLNVLNTPERNLITVEDPVEYQLPGVNQLK